MKIATASVTALAIVGLGIATVTPKGGAALPQQEQATTQADADILYALVRQARQDLRQLRMRAGLDPEIGRAPRQEPMSSAERERQRRRVEAASGGEDGSYIPIEQRSDETYRNGAHMTIAYDAATQSFKGEVRNTTRETLSQVRVEVHLSSGVELGPTKRVDLRPGATIPVELGAVGHQFTHWVTHAEAGVEGVEGGEEGGEGEGHEGGREGAGHEEGGERGEHGGEEGGEEGGEGGGTRPSAANLRPVHNQLQVLLGEIRALTAQLEGNR